MEELQIFRKRYIPNEYILIKDDIIIHKDDEHIITKWQTLNPKSAFSRGSSCYFLKEGFKMSKFYRSDCSLLCWYCDIAEFTFDKSANTFTMTDLLADVIVYPDGRLKVVDLDELSLAHETGLITDEQLHASLKQLNNLLTYIHENSFNLLQDKLENLGL
jgi:predicted RNA-binding protein associated with RNAse of E/G family